MTKFLYGASVQGIQGFIFQTNELKDIVGASELVEFICTDLFAEVVGEGWKECNQVISAAGNVKYIFECESECQKVVRNFPKRVMTEAPGVTISQAVVELEDDFMQSVNNLENRLSLQRNKPNKSIITGRLGIKRSAHTGLPAVHITKEGVIDASTKAKRRHNMMMKLCRKSFGKDFDLQKNIQLPFDLSKSTGKNDWLAVMHVDGNGLGKVVQKVGSKIDSFKIFSHELNEATVAAANDAFRKVSPTGGWGEVIPIRPIVLGGDDMTAIIRGDLAISYVTEFMKQFEKYTGEGKMKTILQEVGLERLTACAGIAFIKSSYPFYYGYELAEQLCKKAKLESKAFDENSVPSCLMFHKVQDSFVMEYEDIINRELMTANSSFCFGPYFLNQEQKPKDFYTIEELEKLSEDLYGKQAEGIKTGIRQWLTLMHDDEGKATQRLKRLKDLNKNQKTLIDKLTGGRFGEDGKRVFPAYDVLTLHTIMNQQTKEV